MSKKLSKQDEGVANYKAWLRENKKLERMGLYGTDYYIKRVEQLEAKVKMLHDEHFVLECAFAALAFCIDTSVYLIVYKNYIYL